MQLQFLGTGAADFLPSLADTDRYTLDKNIRRSSVALVDGEVLIDCGPHLLDEIKLHKAEGGAIRNVLVTHPHGDHFNPDCLRALAAMGEEPLHVWHSRDWELPQMENVSDHPIEIGSTYPIGSLLVTALGANHCPGAVHYSIEKSGKKLFYGCDGAWMLADTFDYMRDKAYDCMVLDATVGDYEGDWRMATHNSIPMIRLMYQSFLSWNVVKDSTKLVLSHLARTLHVSHEDTCRRVEKDGYIVAFDGMKLDV